MRKIKENRKIIIQCFVSIFILFIALFVSMSFTAKSFSEDPNEIKSTYSVGDTLTIPQKQIDGKSGKINSEYTIVYFPSGIAYKTSELILTEAGKYTIMYIATEDGKQYVEEKEIVVNRKFVSFSGVNSSSKYGLDESSYKTNITGLNVSLAQNEKMYFNKIVDLNKLNGEELINFYVKPNTMGQRDTNGMYIYLTDVYDSSNVITIKVQSVGFTGNDYVYRAVYVQTSYSGSDFVGLGYESKSGQIVTVKHIGDRFGTGAYIGWYGTGVKPVGEEFVSFSFDNKEKQLYVSSWHDANQLVVDYDDSTCFSDFWNGFTTGEVEVSIEGYGYSSNTFEFAITSFAGEDLSTTNIYDEEAPEINIDLQGYNTIPEGIVGQEYPVFSASAYDKFDKKIDYTVRAYCGGKSDNRYEINIEDGRILTDKAGTYILIYSAKDRFGLLAEKEIEIVVKNATENFSITPLTSYTTSCKAGELAQFPILDVNNAVGNYEKKIIIDKKNNTTKDGFIPLEVGIYNVKYEFTDFIGRKAYFEYQVEVANPDTPIVLGYVALPNYLLSGDKFTFPTVEAFDILQNKNVACDLYINGEKQTSNVYTAKGSAVNVEYKVSNSVVYSKPNIKVIDVKTDNNLDVTKYFVGENYTITSDSNGVNFTTEGNNKVEFIKPIIFNSFNLTLKFDSVNKNYNEFIINLTDYDNPDNKCKIGFINKGGLTYFIYYDANITYIVSRTGLGSGIDFNIKYEDGTISDGQSINFKIDNYFSAKRVLVDFELNDVTGLSTFSISRLNNQELTSNIIEDGVKPNYILSGEYNTQLTKDFELTIFALIGEDVLSSNVSSKVTLYYGSNVVTGYKELDASKEYKVVLSNYGIYKVIYSFADSNGNSVKAYTIVLYVPDINKPTITIEEEVKCIYSVGSTLELPTASVVDDIDGVISTNYTLVEPGMQFVNLTNKDGNAIFIEQKEETIYIFSFEGNYILKIWGIDNSGNMTVIEKQITVVK